MGLRSEDLSCWQCNANLKGIPLPLGRLAQCPRCRAELHVCLMCVHYDRRYTTMCRHDLADKVLEKERTNFCAHLRPCRGAFERRQDSGEAAARNAAAALFGDAADEEAGAAAGGRPDYDGRRRRARRELEDLFGDDDSDR